MTIRLHSIGIGLRTLGAQLERAISLTSLPIANYLHNEKGVPLSSALYELLPSRSAPNQMFDWLLEKRILPSKQVFSLFNSMLYYDLVEKTLKVILDSDFATHGDSERRYHPLISTYVDVALIQRTLFSICSNFPYKLPPNPIFKFLSFIEPSNDTIDLPVSSLLAISEYVILLHQHNFKFQLAHSGDFDHYFQLACDKDDGTFIEAAFLLGVKFDYEKHFVPCIYKALISIVKSFVKRNIFPITKEILSLAERLLDEGKSPTGSHSLVYRFLSQHHRGSAPTPGSQDASPFSLDLLS